GSRPATRWRRPGPGTGTGTGSERSAGTGSERSAGTGWPGTATATATTATAAAAAAAAANGWLNSRANELTRSARRERRHSEMWLTRLAVGRPLTVLMGLLGLVIMGGVAYTFLKIDRLPPISIPFVSVSMSYTGATAQDVEQLISIPIENA